MARSWGQPNFFRTGQKNTHVISLLNLVYFSGLFQSNLQSFEIYIFHQNADVWLVCDDSFSEKEILICFKGIRETTVGETNQSIRPQSRLFLVGAFTKMSDDFLVFILFSYDSFLVFKLIQL